MPDERFEEHLLHPVGRGERPAGSHDGSAGGAVCGDLVRISVRVRGDRVAAAGFDASGCGAVQAAGSAVVELVTGAPFLDAARVGSAQVAAALGGLSAGKLHAADLASDALHRALGAAVLADGAAPLRADRTLVAMSGGVDSSVAALLCDGEVAGVTLELWRDPENDASSSCCSADAVRGARALAHRLGLPHFTLDLRDEFRSGVVAPWLEGHAAGETPNPCVRCNGHVRLDAMLAFADRIGAQTLATGHYARKDAGGRRLRLAADEAKDQAYALAALRPGTLARLAFPLGEQRKPQVRALARQHGLAVAEKPDSQDLCFLAGTGRARFLARHGRLDDRPGDLVDRSGRVLGRHRGHHHFTVGQRRGLGVHTGEKLYVVATDARRNTVTVGAAEELLVDRVALRALRLHDGVDPACVDGVKLRYKAPVVAARLDGHAVVLDAAVTAPAPGQTAVLLTGDLIVGHATIALKTA